MKRYIAGLLSLIMLVGFTPVVSADEISDAAPTYGEAETATPAPEEEIPGETPIETGEIAVAPTEAPLQAAAEATKASAPAEATEAAVPMLCVAVSSASVEEDGSAEITAAVEMSFDGEVSYDWQKRTDGEDDWQSIGCHEETLHLSDLTAADCAATRWRCVVTAGDMSATSNELSLDASQINAALPTSAEDFRYTVKDDKCTITKYNGSATELIIPPSIEDATVTAIAEYAFEDCVSLTSVVIPDTVTSIGQAAFTGCAALTCVNLPSGLTKIADELFFDCACLSDITLPGGINEIGAFAFSNCAALTRINLPSGLTAIGKFAFFGCAKLTSVTLPQDIRAIEDSTFSDCAALTQITLPDKLTEISYQACARGTLFGLERPRGYRRD